MCLLNHIVHLSALVSLKITTTRDSFAAPKYQQPETPLQNPHRVLIIEVFSYSIHHNEEYDVAV